MEVMAKEFVGGEITSVCRDSYHGDYVFNIEGNIISRGSLQDMLNEAIRHKQQYKDWIKNK